MATSGSTNFTVNRDTLIKDSLLMLDAIALEQIPSAAVIDHASRQLNLILKSIQTLGLPLWTIKSGYVFLDKTKSVYKLGPSGDHSAYSYVTSTLSVGEATASVSIDVASTTGMAATNNIGIKLTSGNLFWTTILSVNSATNLTITTGLPSAAAISNPVFVYASKIQRPLQIPEAWISLYAGAQIPIEVVARKTQTSFGTSVATGPITSIYFDPQLNNAEISIYPNFPNDVSTVLGIKVQRPIEDVDISTDDFDLPQEWLLFLQCKLALLLAPAYPVTASNINTIAGLLAKEEDQLMSFDKENNTSMFLQPRSM